jgi:apolipoprotein N-acyltransferase
VTLVRLTKYLPLWKNALLAVLAAVLLILSFPDFEFWFLAWVALVPLLFAIELETERGHSCPHEPEGRKRFFRTLTRSWGQECPRSFILGWIFGVVFFFGTCWWLTFAPITYAGFPPLLAYFLLFCVTAVAAIFPGLFTAVVSVFLRRFGSWAFLLAPFVWVFTEFLRYWLTGNNWNAIGYSQAFGGWGLIWAAFSGVLAVGFAIVAVNSIILTVFSVAITLSKNKKFKETFKDGESPPLSGFHFWPALLASHEATRSKDESRVPAAFLLLFPVIGIGIYYLISFLIVGPLPFKENTSKTDAVVVAIQPNVPMAGMTEAKWNEYRRNHVRLAESALATLPAGNQLPTTVVFPESPMNFAYASDPETQAFINGFAAKNNVSVLFNSAEPDLKNGKYYNSAVMVGPDGKEVAQYDKIYLLPFGEAVPFPLEGILPGFVGNFSYGGEYDLFPFGDARGGVMICFESHFGQLSREYVRNGADVIIEMTNDGYLGPTPVLRQHLANAVFRAVETNRPVLRVTNVGITAYVHPSGVISDAAETYIEATRTWPVAKSDGSQTFYVKYGDWFAWLCSIVTVGFLVLTFARPKV